MLRLTIAAIGRLKADGERQIMTRYGERIDALGRGQGFGPLRLVELVESRAASSSERKIEEALALIKAAGERSQRIALDEHGKVLSSRAFATLLARERDAGVADLAFLIGGPDGHGEPVLGGAGQKLSLSAMTLPHGLARVVLVEQVYRAVTILAGHPYHRD